MARGGEGSNSGAAAAEPLDVMAVGSHCANKPESEKLLSDLQSTWHQFVLLEALLEATLGLQAPAKLFRFVFGL